MVKSSAQNERLAKRIFPQKPVARAESNYELFGIDTFFVYRAAAYIAVGVMVVLISLLRGEAPAQSLLSVAILIFFLTACFGGRMLYIGSERKYFVLELTCADIQFPKGYETIGNFLNPASQTAFRKTQRVTFLDENGHKIAFTFERGRRFLQDRKYALYFHALQPGEEATVDVLERLKIDHRIIPQKLEV
jgi:hypothetical protein